MGGSLTPALCSRGGDKFAGAVPVCGLCGVADLIRDLGALVVWVSVVLSRLLSVL